MGKKHTGDSVTGEKDGADFAPKVACGRRRTALALICLFAGANPGIAQERVDSYKADYFAANQPATAYDMVALLPGFRLQLGDANLRGFSGTVGNVLIDGQLPTSKEDTIDILLRRIPAA